MKLCFVKAKRKPARGRVKTVGSTYYYVLRFFVDKGTIIM